jgi:hypothetical protein
MSGLFHQWSILIFVVILLFSKGKFGGVGGNMDFRVSVSISKTVTARVLFMVQSVKTKMFLKS